MTALADDIFDTFDYFWLISMRRLLRKLSRSSICIWLVFNYPFNIDSVCSLSATRDWRRSRFSSVLRCRTYVCCYIVCSILISAWSFNAISFSRAWTFFSVSCNWLLVVFTSSCSFYRSRVYLLKLSLMTSSYLLLVSRPSNTCYLQRSSS